jgi:hypothetical protein
MHARAMRTYRTSDFLINQEFFKIFSLKADKLAGDVRLLIFQSAGRMQK